MWSWGRPATQHMGEARALGARWQLLGGVPGDLKFHSRQMSGSWRQGHRLEALRVTLESLSLELTLSAACVLGPITITPPEEVGSAVTPTYSAQTEAQQGRQTCLRSHSYEVFVLEYTIPKVRES